MPMHDLLVEPVFHVTMPGGHRAVLTLPGVLAELARDDIVSFDHLRPHQEHAWYAFLVQLVAIALNEEGLALDQADEPRWRERLLRLTKDHGGHAPWCLIVEDLSLPAFMQPPLQEGEITEFKEPVAEPDAPDLDLLVTAKGHDVKPGRASIPRLDHWPLTLVALQTMQGYSGAKNYGIARMNGGYGSRPCVTFAPGPGWGSRLRRDVGILLGIRKNLAEQFGYRQQGGGALMWLEPWDGLSALDLRNLDPYFIEVCRRVRLAEHDGKLIARTKGTVATRTNAGLYAGNLGDPWMPVGADGKALSVSGKSGFGYQRSAELLFGRDFVPSPTQIVTDLGAGDVMFFAWALSRGQGKTEGLHERWVPLPARVRRRLLTESDRASFGELARQRVQTVRTLQDRVLRPALCVLLQGAPGRLKLRDNRASRWVRQHDAAVDQLFFPRLWRDLERDSATAQTDWQRELINLGRALVREAETSVPLSAARRYGAIAAAEGMFEGLARRHFPDVFAEEEAKHDHSA